MDTEFLYVFVEADNTPLHGVGVSHEMFDKFAMIMKECILQ